MYGSRDEAFFSALAKRPGCVLEYFLMKNDGPETGEEAHRAALAFAMAQIGAAWPALTADVRRAAGLQIPAAELLALPEKPWKREETYKGLPVVLYDNAVTGEKLRYWYAFLEPPHGSGCTPEDFRAVNAALFPRGTEGLEVIEWSTDWSSYFDEGHEWWGAACWSVYDPALDRYAVILASATD